MGAQAQTVLVVEDESSIASFVALYLKNAGYAVRTAATGGEALAQEIRSHGHRDVTYVEKRADAATALLPSSSALRFGLSLRPYINPRL